MSSRNTHLSVSRCSSSLSCSLFLSSLLLSINLRNGSHTIIRMLNEPMTIDTIKLINCSVSATCTCSLPTQLPKGAERYYLFSVFSAVALNLRMPSISWSSDKLGIFLNTLSNSVSSSFEKFILPIAPPSLLNKPLISVLFAK